MAKILLVDDSDTYRIKFKTYLEDKGHVVIDGIDGEEGLNLAEKTDGLDLIISDLRLPLFDGLTMIEKLRETEKYKEIPVIMITTEAGPEYKKRGRDLAVRAWIQKPLNFELVETVLGKILNE